jgi:hypothetical protein
MTSGRLPTFLVIGAMKAGTTSLWHQLRSHPQIYMPEVKELHYFSNAPRLARGVEWYRAQFADAPGEVLAVGEASTNYTKYPRLTGTAARIAGLIPDVRLVYLVRDPISRMRSHYLHVVHGHGERRPFPVAVREDPEYLDISRYRTQIDQYLAHFQASQLLVITAEELRDRGAVTMGRVLEFIGVERRRDALPPSSERHRSADKRVPTELSTRVRHLPGYSLVRRATPPALRRVVRRTTTRPVATTVDTSVPDDLRREIEEQLRDEVAGLRPFLGATFDGWGIA